MDSSPAPDRRHSALLRFLVGREVIFRPAPDSWPEWIDDAWRHRVVPLLYHLVESMSTGLRDYQLEQLEAAQIEVMRVAAQHDANLLHIARLLESERITAAAVKGAATGNLDYPDPNWRQYGDLDLLVRPNDLWAAVEILVDDGWRTAYPLPHGHEGFAHAITLVKPRGWELDLHQRVAHRSVGLRIPTDELLNETIQFEIAGASVRALTTRDRLVHAAIHEAMSRSESKRLSSVADVLLLSSANAHLAGDVIDRADRWRLRPMLEQSIRRAFRSAALELPAEWESAFKSPVKSRDRLIELAYGSDRRRPAFEEIAHLRLMPLWHDRARYVKSLIFAGDEYARLSGRRGAKAQTRYLIDRLRNR